jgi:hypothetical protein
MYSDGKKSLKNTYQTLILQEILRFYEKQFITMIR